MPSRVPEATFERFVVHIVEIFKNKLNEILSQCVRTSNAKYSECLDEIKTKNMKKVRKRREEQMIRLLPFVLRFSWLLVLENGMGTG